MPPTQDHPSVNPSAGEAPSLSRELAAEINAAMEKQLNAAPPAASAAKPAIRGPRVVQAGREHRTGKVVSVGPSDIFIEFGPKELGVVERTQYPEGTELPKPGETIELVVTKRDDDGLFICARPGAVQKAHWETLEAGQTIEAKVVGVNKGGLDMEIAGGHHAFLPASQVGLDRIPDLSALIGEKLTCQVERVDKRGKGNIILSRRNLLAQEREQRKQALQSTLREGATVDGTVRKIMSFGAFVDLGGVDGLVHISDMTHDRVPPTEKNVAKYVKEGQAVRVVILKLDWDANRISLGMKQLQEDPFLTAMNEVKEGEEVSGRVKSITEFGCFVEVAPGIEGLVHISELDWKRVNRVEDVVRADEIIKVKVLKIESGTRKISLSLKQTKAPPERPASGPSGGKGKDKGDRRSPEDILKQDPAFRRLKAKAGRQQLKGGF
ncbi:MAG: S1 RNA-binding domain-containing protein [Phycisphaeraceae bacterium]|nr:S1 RNA-binding domain-containing protein [Phycisphaeraceae bacterium]MCW5754681.1 S1 RNA-binding domain-containing protein [Phycisphaeraceae bacterium]